MCPRLWHSCIGLVLFQTLTVLYQFADWARSACSDWRQWLFCLLTQKLSSSSSSAPQHPGFPTLPTSHPPLLLPPPFPYYLPHLLPPSLPGREGGRKKRRRRQKVWPGLLLPFTLPRVPLEIETGRWWCCSFCSVWSVTWLELLPILSVAEHFVPFSLLSSLTTHPCHYLPACLPPPCLPPPAQAGRRGLFPAHHTHLPSRFW